MKRENNNRIEGRRGLFAGWRSGLLALWIGGGFATMAGAQQTNAPVSNNLAAFQIISERNIFNPNRSPGRKGLFAFFAGSSSDYQKAVTVDDTIAGFRVTGIRRDAVTLEREGNKVELKMGDQMRREDRGEWRASTPQPVRTDGETRVTVSTEPPDVGSSEMNDVLRRMMERRAREEQRAEEVN
jgi:hypothetical protein